KNNREFSYTVKPGPLRGPPKQPDSASGSRGGFPPLGLRSLIGFAPRPPLHRVRSPGTWGWFPKGQQRRLHMRTLIALLMAALPIASAAADQYSIVPYATSRPEGAQLETIWRAVVINESRPGLAYCQAVTKISSGASVVSIKCRAQKLTSGS